MSGRLSREEIQQIYSEEVARFTVEQTGHLDELVEPEGAIGHTIEKEEYPWGAVYYQLDKNGDRIRPANGVTAMVHGGTQFPWSDPDVMRLVNFDDEASIKEVAHTVVLSGG
jgi:hypothetical protein